MAQRWNPRQAMLEDRYELFHYLDRQVEVELHHHDFYEIYFFLSGQVRYCINGETYQLTPGDLLLMAPDELHQPLVQPGQEYERYVLWISRPYLARLSAPDADLSACFRADSPSRRRVLRSDPGATAHMRRVFQQLLADGEAEDGPLLQLERAGLLTHLLALVNRLCLTASPVSPDNCLTPTMAELIAYIDSHITEPLTLEELAARFYVSKYHLLREFQKSFGLTIHRYVQKRRLMQAKLLLAQGQKPSALYTQCGFRDYATFYRAFTGEYGLSPSAYLQLSAQGGG